jgi:hemoglobin
MSDLPSDANDRRAGLSRDIMAETGIDEAMIGRLVRTFYREIRVDPILGPIFNARITNWDDHIEKLCAFWSSVALMSGRYHGQPMQAHVALPVQRSHFDRWLDLFERTAIETCGPTASSSESLLRRGVSSRRGTRRTGAPLGPPAQGGVVRPK